ncbi:MAG: aminopeptidase [Pseudomonadales bacterium]|nr:aminopeptidase [Pseudomonadales bacterium]
MKIYRLIPLSLSLVTLLFLSGCESIRYYSQAVSGQLSILHKRQDLDTVINDPHTEALLKARLQQVQKMRVFAEDRLFLPVGDSYSSYVDLERDYVVWNIYAAEELSLTSKTWCFPVAGCVAYKGYFSSQPAKDKAKQLKDDGYDVHVAGIRAYSTLGWFDDPILNTFINDEELSLAGLLFHELAHRQQYIKNDTAFNESLATAISDIGLQKWIAANKVRYTDKSFSLYLQKRKNHQRFKTLLMRYRGKLQQVYQNEKLADADKRLAKKQTLAALDTAYQSLKVELATDRYDKWMADMNNAKLANIANYNVFVPAFKKLYDDVNQDMEVFYRRTDAMEALEKDERHRLLKGMM